MNPATRSPLLSCQKRRFANQSRSVKINHRPPRFRTSSKSSHLTPFRIPYITTKRKEIRVNKINYFTNPSIDWLIIDTEPKIFIFACANKPSDKYKSVKLLYLSHVCFNLCACAVLFVTCSDANFFFFLYKTLVKAEKKRNPAHHRELSHFEKSVANN